MAKISSVREIKDIEALIGGNWFNRIGIFAIILAVGFFLKYAFENQWIGPAGRVMIGIAIGIGFLLAGERMRSRGYRYYAHGLSGGGIAILYLSIFAAFSRYHLIDQLPAFFLMSLVTAAAVLLAARYDALAIAILGLIGGFLTPIMLSTGKDNQAGLFSYITLLDLGVLAIAYFKQWRILNYLAFLATVLISAAWLDEWYAPEKLWKTVFFLTILFIIFALLAVLHNVLKRKLVERQDIVLIFANAGLYFGTCYELLEPKHHPYLGMFAVLLSAFYLGLGYLTYRRDREDRYLVLTFLGLASLFLTLAIPIQMNQHWVTMAWAIEGVVLTWIGLRAESRYTRFAALVVFGVAFLHWIDIDLAEFAFRPQSEFIPFFNRRAASAVMLIASLAGAAWLYQRRGEKVESKERRLIAGGCALAANVMVLIWLSLDARDYFEKAKFPLRERVDEDPSLWVDISKLDNLKHFILTTLWSLYGGALLTIGLVRKLRALRYFALALLGLAAYKAVIIDSTYFDTAWHRVVINPTFGAFVVLIAVIGYGYWRYSATEGIESREREATRALLLAAGNMLAIFALSLEANGYFSARMITADESRAASLAGGKQFTLTALWTIYAVATIALALKNRIRWLRLAAFGLLALATLKLLFVDLFVAVEGRPPLFNQTFASFLVVIAGLAYCGWLYSRTEAVEESLRSRVVPMILVAANLLALLALSVESDNYFATQLLRAGATAENWRDLQLGRQLSLSIIWTVYGGAMLAVGIWRGNRLLRIMALGLLGLTIVKVFLFDLSALDKIYRVISFVVLGAILLAVSFLYQRLQVRAPGGKE